MINKIRNVLKGLKDTLKYKSFNPLLFQIYSSIPISKYSDFYLVNRIKHEAHLLDKATKNPYIPRRGDIRACYLYKLIQELEQRGNIHLEVLSWAKSMFNKFKDWKYKEVSQHKEGVVTFDSLPEFAVPSIRFWEYRKPLRNDILKCVEAAQLAPASCNRQAFLIRIAVNNKFSKTCVGASNNSMFESVPYRVFIFINMRNYTEKFSCFIDLGMFAQNFILKAKSLSLGCCCCYASEHLEKGQSFYRDKFNLGNEYYCGLTILVGHPKEIVEKPPRVNVNTIVKFLNL